MADVAELAKQLAAELGGECRAEEDGTYTLFITSDGEPAMALTLYQDTVDDGPAQGSELLMIRALAGGLEESIETFLLEDACSTWFARAYLEEDEEDDDAPPEVIIEAGLPLAGLTLPVAHQAVIEVIDLVTCAADYVYEEEEDADGE